MERIDEILIKLREFAEHSAEDTRIEIKKIDIIRLIDYIDKLEDIEMYFKLILNTKTQINIEK